MSEGAWVTPETLLTTLQDTSRIKIDFSAARALRGAPSRSGRRSASASPGAASAFEGSVARDRARDRRADAQPAACAASRRTRTARCCPGAFVSVELPLEQADGGHPGAGARRSCRRSTGHARLRAARRPGRAPRGRDRAAHAATSVQVLRGLAVGDDGAHDATCCACGPACAVEPRGDRRRRRREPLRGQHPPAGPRDRAARSCCVLFGGVAFAFLGVREYPAVDPPIVTVHDELPRREPRRDRVADHRAARAADQRHRRHPRALLDLERGAQPDPRRVRGRRRPRGGRQRRARQASSRAIRNLPPDADPPVVEKADADSEPIVFLSVRSPTREHPRGERLRRPRGARSASRRSRASRNVRIFGEKRYAMRLWLDPARLAAHGLTPLDVQAALAAAERRPAERPPRGQRASSSALRTAGRLTTPSEFDAHDPRGARTAGRSQLARRRPRRARRREPAHRHQARSACRWSALARDPAAEHQRDRDRRRVLPAPRGDPRAPRPADYHDRDRLRLHDASCAARSREVEETLAHRVRAGRAHHLPLPARLALDADPGARDPGQHRVGVLRDVPGRLHDQRADAGRASCSRSAWSATTRSSCSRTSTRRSSAACRRSRPRSRARARSTSR